MSWIPRIGAEFASYRLDSLLGHGGMSIVYKAEHTVLGRMVALKLLSPQLSDDESFRERFMRESRLAASLDHPNIIPIYEASEHEDVFFIAMRYVEGSDLRTLLKRESPLSTERTISIVNQVANALTAAHAKGLVHRDVKPANILIDLGSGTDGTDHVYLSDFGVAKHLAAPGLTQTGIFVGTADYASPEQIEGKELDGRADVYSLGCVVYECLTGSSAYDKDSEVALMYAHLLEPPPSVTDRRPDLPAEVDEVVSKAMAKSRDERYASPSELTAALRAALAAAPSRAPETVFAGTATPPPPTEAHAVAAEAPQPTSVPGTTPAAPATSASGAAQPPGEPAAKSSRRPLVWAAAAAVLLALAIGGILAATGGDDDADSASGGDSLQNTLLGVLVPSEIATACTTSAEPRVGAVETNACTPSESAPSAFPDELELSFFPNASALEEAYQAEKTGVEIGRCGSTAGERAWIHQATGIKGGRRFCYTDGDAFVIVWVHERLDSVDHVDMLGVAREPGRAPTSFTNWWGAVNDNLGKCRPQVSEATCQATIDRLAPAT